MSLVQGPFSGGSIRNSAIAVCVLRQLVAPSQRTAEARRTLSVVWMQLDGDTVAMIKELKVPDLRTMLRKRGINPSGSRDVLQQRLSTFLLVRSSLAHVRVLRA